MCRMNDQKEQEVGAAFAVSIRRGLAQADAGETVVCESHEDMVAMILDADPETSLA